MVDPALAAAALVLGCVIGLTGMGGGALMTPILVGLFGVPPGVAVASDLVASAVMKPAGAAVHLRSRNADLVLTRWLVIGSVPPAFLAPIIAYHVFGGVDDSTLRVVIGAVVLASSALGLLRAYLTYRRPRREPQSARRYDQVALVILGAVAGTLVGLTSVGSGSLVAAGLVMLFPALSGSRLTGTDLVQAVPMVWAAALGHAVIGQFDLAVTTSVVIGGVPGVVLGSLLATRVRGHWLKAVVLGLLVLSGLTMIGISLPVTIPAAVAVGLVQMWLATRRRQDDVDARGDAARGTLRA